MGLFVEGLLGDSVVVDGFSRVRIDCDVMWCAEYRDVECVQDVVVDVHDKASV